jgi:hypothetical protein
MDNKRLLTPGFINGIDRQLLKNNPVTWSTRIHLALYYGLGLFILLAILCFIVPDEPKNYSRIENWIILLSVISLLAFVFWMVYLLRFNVFKRFGKWGSLDSVKTYSFYFFITLLIVSWPFVPPIVQSIRANAAYASNELANDINNMNLKLCQLERDSLDIKFQRDTFQVTNRIMGTEKKEIPYNGKDQVINLYGYYYIDTAVLRNKLNSADSVRKISDSVYIFYECPELQFIYNYSLDDRNEVGILSSMDLYRQTLQNRQIIDKQKMEKEIAQLFSKYSYRHGEGSLLVNYDSYPDNTQNWEKLNAERVKDKYDLYYVSNSIDNITGKKFRWDEGTIAVCWRVAYYITLVLSLLVLIYRHTTRRTFFLSLLTAVVLSILTGLFLSISSSNEGAFFTWAIFYFIIFSVLSATIINARRRSLIPGIGLNLLVFITPFMPLIITASYYSALRRKYEYGFEWGKHKHLFINEKFHYFIAEIGGFILLLVLLATLYQMAYKKWYSLPEQ